MSEAPELIYLQWIPEEARDNYEDVITWCEDEINDDDIEYVKASTATRLRELLERAYIIYMDTGKIPTHLLLEIHRELKYPKETEDA